MAKIVIDDWSDPESIREIEDKDEHKYAPAFVWELEWRDKVVEVAQTRADAKRAWEDTASLMYELINERELARNEKAL